ncbi:MAG: lipid-A-disaccharide synthase, partial [Planctomycetes bacterium]|nr:lipid-A-disaccharide synthase [Planctomycetota bacterium]
MNPAVDSSTRAPRLFIVAGEPSGDGHASRLLLALRRLAPGIEARGFGGPQLEAAGMELLEDLASDAIMGLFPVLAALPRIRGWFRRALDELERDPPDALVVVDYPGFNLRLALAAKARGLRVIYYISPQVWAWNRRRVRTIARSVDLMIPILPFEEDFYAGAGIEVYYPGHPLADQFADFPYDEAVRSDLARFEERPLVGLFPGSRRHVVESLGPVFLRAARALRQKPGLEAARFVVAAARPDFGAWFENHAEAQD